MNGTIGRLALAFALSSIACSSDGGGGTAGAGGSDGGTPTCSNCPGCCAGTSCVAFSQQDSTTCGANGATCAACSFGFKCEVGGCVVDDTVCSPASCKDGCCSGNVCVLPDAQNWTACGSLGSACGTCSTGLACVAGSCDPTHWSDDALFKLTALEIANCSCTDTVGLPDPFVALHSPTSNAATNTCDDVVGCKFSSGSIDVTAGDLIAGKVTIDIYDEDVSYNDYCGGGAIKLASPIPVLPSYEASFGGQKFKYKLEAK